MTNQKAPYKYCYSVSSDQKCHPVRSLYVSKTLLIFQGSSSSQNYESQHLGIYHSHMNHWKVQFISHSYTVSQKESTVYANNLEAISGMISIGLCQLWPKLLCSKRLP